MVDGLSVDTRVLRPGASEAYHAVHEELGELVPAILRSSGLAARGTARILSGETNAVVWVPTDHGEVLVKLSPYSDLATEVYFVTRLSEHRLPGPELLSFDVSSSRYQWVMYRPSSGVSADHLPASQRARAGSLVGAFLRALHSVGESGFGGVGSDGAWTHRSMSAALRMAYFDGSFAAERSRLLSDGEVALVSEFLGDDSLWVSEPRLLHGDMALGNFLFEREGSELRLACVIDPGEIIGGDPMLDVAGGSNDFDDFGRGLLEGYGESSLKDEERSRLYRLQAVTLQWSACWHLRYGLDHREPLAHLRRVLSELAR